MFFLVFRLPLGEEVNCYDNEYQIKEEEDNKLYESFYIRFCELNVERQRYGSGNYKSELTEVVEDESLVDYLTLLANFCQNFIVNAKNFLVQNS